MIAPMISYAMKFTTERQASNLPEVVVFHTFQKYVFTISRMLGIQRSWYYRQLNPDFVLEVRFNPSVVNN
ncbi:MAG: hypothetical protein ACYDAZ_05115 [Thermoplasmataceae archaeon]